MNSKLFKEERMNPLVGTEGLHFIVTQDDAGDTVLHVFNSEDEADLYHGQLRGYGGVKRIGRLKGSKRLYLGSDIIAGVTRQFGAEPRMIRHDDKENPRDARASSRKEEYNDYDEWERDAFAAGATQIVKVGDGLSAIRTKDGSMLKVDAEGYFDPRSRYGVKMRKSFINIGAWYMDSGTIYRHIIKNHPEFFAYENPVRPRKGEPSRAFVSRCMSEEKMSFPEPKQRIAVCLSKSRKRNPVYDTGSDE